ncbi:MAG: UvrD-helicase domain-containing protein [Planctomycetia bacterium]|nr:UvrD-helicase domain-containing protein [Planctomycetia bacterium]
MFDNLIIRASAGSGKTYRLSHRYLGLVAGGVPVETILASTFSNKAAGEIRNRVLLLAAEICEDAKKREEFCQNVGISLERAESFGILRNLVNHLHRMRVQTLDSFFTRLALCFSYEMGLEPGWAILEDSQRETLAWGALRRTFADDTEVILRILRGLFPGETTQGVASQVYRNIQGMVSWIREVDRAAWERVLSIRVTRYDGWLDEPDLVGNIGILEQAAFQERGQGKPRKMFLNALEKAASLAKADDWPGLLSETLISHAFDDPVRYGRMEISDMRLVHALRALGRHARCLFLRQIQEQTRSTYEILRTFALELDLLKRQKKGLEYADITWVVSEYVREHPAPEDFFWRLDAPIRHLLLDEFQDTSLDQWRILEPLGRRCVSGEGASFFCVGDVKQAIYRWRNGREEIFGHVANTFPNLKAEDSNKSWRSAKEIIHCVNRLFGKTDEEGSLPVEELLDPVRLRAWREWAFQEHTTGRLAYPGYWELCVSPREADAADSEGGETESAVLAYAAQKIAELYDRVGNHSIGVLLRSNEKLGQLVAALRKLGVPASEEGKITLDISPSVRILLSLLRLVEHPGDSVSHFHVAHSPLVERFPVLAWHDPWEPRPVRESAWDALSAFLSQFREQIQAQGFAAVLEPTARFLMGKTTPDDARRLEQLIEKAGEYDVHPGPRIQDFVQFILSEKISDPSSAKVSVTSIHQSKGLQYDCVVLPELNFGLGGRPPQFVLKYPDNDVLQPPEWVVRWVNDKARDTLPEACGPMREAMEQNLVERTKESFCMLYVAMTRAIYGLYLIVPPAMRKDKAHSLVLGRLAGVTKVEENQLLLSEGDAAWYLHTGRPLPDDAERTPTVLREQIPPAWQGGASRSLIRRSPSNVEENGLVSLERKLNFRRSNTLNGTVLHKWYERIIWYENSIPSDEELLALARPYGLPETACAILLTEFRQSLKKSRVRAVFSWTQYLPILEKRIVEAGILSRERLPRTAEESTPEGIRWEVHREKELAVRNASELFLGTVDRLVLLRDDAQVYWADCIDFKTTRKAPRSHMAELIEKHAPQLVDYRNMLAAHYCMPLEQVTARLVFSMLGIVEEVE